MNICVVGAQGKLGSQIVKTIQDNGDSPICVDKILNNTLQDFSNIDAVIDASNAANSIKTATYCKKQNLPLLIASTGHTNAQLKKIDNLCKNISFCVCPNLSVGVQFVMQSLKNLPLLQTSVISIEEIHHIHKKDCPSGTAKMLANHIENLTNKQVEITSIRKGDAVGTHTIQISLPLEQICITHTATSREVFASGAYMAIKKLATLPAGKHSFLNLLGGNNAI